MTNEERRAGHTQGKSSDTTWTMAVHNIMMSVMNTLNIVDTRTTSRKEKGVRGPFPNTDACTDVSASSQ
jgi:hypothetical protein